VLGVTEVDTEYELKSTKSLTNPSVQYVYNCLPQHVTKCSAA
jgi:hypothetical protein